MIYSFYGAIKAGAVPIPTNILMKAPDFLYMLNDSRAPVLIVDTVFSAGNREDPGPGRIFTKGGGLR